MLLMKRGGSILGSALALMQISFSVIMAAAGALISTTSASGAQSLSLKVAGRAGHANGERLVKPDCANSTVRITPCGRVAATWVRHLNSRIGAFISGYRAAGYTDEVTSILLDCSSGIYSDRATRKGQRKSRHAFGEACDGNFVRINSVTFEYRTAVRKRRSQERKFFIAFLDGWGDIGPGCRPKKGAKIFGYDVGCELIPVDNCGVIDWRERGRLSQYGSTYHLSYCYYTDPLRAYE
ncbi:MAG: hypothetical protein AAGD43_22720 [Pseudomonadota bacterium]